jgi:hypothetical protein
MITEKDVEFITWFGISSVPLRFTNRSIAQLVYLDDFYKTSERKSHSERIVHISESLKKDIVEQYGEKESDVKTDANINYSDIAKKLAINKIQRFRMIDDPELDIKILKEVFENFYQNDYRIPYDKNKRRLYNGQNIMLNWDS